MKSNELVISVDVEDGKGGKERTVYIRPSNIRTNNTMIYKRTRKNRKDENNYLFTARTSKGNKPKKYIETAS